MANKHRKVWKIIYENQFLKNKHNLNIYVCVREREILKIYFYINLKVFLIER